MSVPEEPKQERVWVAAGALVGVIVAGIVIGVLIFLQGGGDDGGVRAPVAPPSTRAATAGTPADLAKARDDALKAAEESLVTLNTVDSKAAQAGIDRWEAVTTSPLLEELKTKHAENLALYSGGKLSSSAKVLSSAVSRITGDGSSADVLVYLEVSTTDTKGSATKQVREKAVMLQTAGGWKLSVRTTIQPPA
jgi:hypothetical protein